MTTDPALPWATRTLGLTLHHRHSWVPADAWDIPALIQPGLRRNPRRAHLLVSTVLGKHLPTDPHRVLDAGNRLGDLVLEVLKTTAAQGDSGALDTAEVIDVASGTPGAEPKPADTAAAVDVSANNAASTAKIGPGEPETAAVVLGFAETATGLGHTVAARMNAQCYLHSTRRDVPTAETLTGFEEGHSHATSHLLQPAPAAIFRNQLPMVLVDDEISTGATAIDAIRALHAFTPRPHYILASLVDMRTEADKRAFEAAADELGVRIDTVCLAAGHTHLPEDLLDAVQALPDPELNPVAVVRGTVIRVDLPWPDAVPEGGRHGFLHSDTTRFDAAVDAAAALLAETLARADAMDQVPSLADRTEPKSSDVDRSAAGAGDRASDQVRAADARPAIVIAHEELMYLPLRLAAALSDRGIPTLYQTTTRSPAYVLDEPGYPLRRGFRFTAPELDESAPRFVYNADWPDRAPGDPAPRLLLVLDDPADTEHLTAPGGLIDVLTASGADIVVAVLPAADPRALHAARRANPVRAAATFDQALPGDRLGAAGPGRSDETESDSGSVTVPDRDRPRAETSAAAVAATLPEPLRGPGFGSYRADEVGWLLKDLSAVALEAEVGERERRIQAGVAHYAESLPVEYQPDAAYRELFDKVLAESAERLALAVATVAELVVAERGEQVVLVSLARAGTPVGVLMRRWLARRGVDAPHYAVSIVRERGIDSVALDYLARHHDPAQVVFVDGWTGKGAITRELNDALDEYHAAGGARFNGELAVLADPGGCVRTYGTRDDFLIASACLNSTVSGLISRTVLNAELIGPGEFHGAKFYRELADQDVSNRLLDAVTDSFDTIAPQVSARLEALLAADRSPTWAGWASVERVRADYGISSVNFVKPGVGETTRVLLRRVPWRVLVREADAPEHAHIRMLAAARGVPVEVVPDLAYACMGLIKDVKG